jgi:hypothetical protein
MDGRHGKIGYANNASKSCSTDISVVSRYHDVRPNGVYAHLGTRPRRVYRATAAYLRQIRHRRDSDRRHHGPSGAFLFHKRLASSSEAKSYEVNGIFLVCKMRKMYSVKRMP